MTKRYTNCPTCGTSCSYISDNMKAANIVSHLEPINLREELLYLAYDYSRILLLLDSKYDLDNLDSSELLMLYYRRIRREIPIMDMLSLRPNIHNKIRIAILRIIEEYEQEVEEEKEKDKYKNQTRFEIGKLNWME
jgi:SUMO ligase MMS21 Smc5/6 complex component